MTFVSTPQNMGRAWHGYMVLGFWTDNLVPNPGLVKGFCGSQESEGVVYIKRYDLREIY